MSSVGRPKEHNEQTAVALLEAAESAIEERGVDALSVRGVAADVGASTRAVYSLFGSKEGLVAALAVRAFDLLGSAIGDLATTSDPAADLIEAGLAFRRFAIEHPSLFAIGVQRSEALPDELWAQVRRASARALGVFKRRIERLRAAGLLGSRKVGDAAAQIHAYCEGMAALELRRGIRVDKKLWESGLTALVRGFAMS
jgi:AcrR family transcriptional regulator